MILTLIILATIAVLGHKFVMNAVNNYTYDNTIERYENRNRHMYWDIIKEQNKFN
jgi:hypothetical protein